MKTFALSVFLLLGCVAGSWAETDLVQCGWEGAVGPFGYYGNGSPPMFATITASPDPVYEGLRSLRLEDNCPSGTPQAYVAYLYNLHWFDSVHVSVMCYDDTPGEEPTGRLWAHWSNTLPGDIDGYWTSAGGTEIGTDGSGWQRLEYEWTNIRQDGLVIELRIYGEAGDVLYFDDLRITVTHSDLMWVYVVTPCETVVPNETMSFDALKALYR